MDYENQTIFIHRQICRIDGIVMEVEKEKMIKITSREHLKKIRD